MALSERQVQRGGEALRRQHTRVEIEQSLDQLSNWMDGVFRVPGVGWRFGLDALVGLVPAVGDLATTAVSFYILAAGVRYRVPKVTLARMAANVAVDYLAGSVPFAGDLFDAAWKSNQKNVALVRERATVSAEEARDGRLSDWLFLGALFTGLLALLAAAVAFNLWLLMQLFGGFR